LDHAVMSGCLGALEHTDTKRVSREIIRRTIKKPAVNPGRIRNGVFRWKRTLSLQPA
jgi:hypothetical protein